MDLIGRSGGKPGKQGKNKWEEPVKAEDKPVENIVPAAAQQSAAEEKNVTPAKADKAKEHRAQSKKAQQDAISLLNSCKKAARKGAPKSIYINYDNLVFLDMLKSKKGYQYASVVNMLIDDFRKKYDGSVPSGDAEEDE